jgi:hypothetical protein
LSEGTVGENQHDERKQQGANTDGGTHSSSSCLLIFTLLPGTALSDTTRGSRARI